MCGAAISDDDACPRPQLCETAASDRPPKTAAILAQAISLKQHIAFACVEVLVTFASCLSRTSCEELSWDHCTSTPHRSETNAISERAVRRVKEGTSAVLLQSGLNESWWADSWNIIPICETSQISYLMGRRPMKDVLGNHLQDLLLH